MKYRYVVESNVPLNLYSGLGNHPTITPDPIYGLTRRDVVSRMESNGAATADGHVVTMELAEVIEEAQTEPVTHLFVPGSLITKCCKRVSFDSRLKGSLGTYDEAAATCPGSED